MKKLLALITCLVMLCLVPGALADGIVLQDIPAEEAVRPNPADPYDDPLEGFYKWFAEIDKETTRDFIVYIPASGVLKMQTVYIACPAGVDPAQFLVDTGWVAAAEKHIFRIACLYTDGEWAENPADDFPYLEAVRARMRKRIYWNAGNASFYLVGYEGGADLMSYAAMIDGTHYAGLAAFGGKGVSSEVMDKLATMPVDHEGFIDESKTFAELPARTWMFVPEMTDQLQANVNFWKKANSVADNAIALNCEYADEMYLQPAFTDTLEWTEQSVGALYLTKTADFYAEGLAEKVYTQFLQKAWRYEGYANCGLRAYKDPRTDDHFSYHNIEVDGWNREYWVYVPDCVKDSAEPVPMVLAIHGSGGTSWEMITRTDWHKVAARAGFIVVYPTGLFGSDSTGAGTGWNTGAAKENRVDDIVFARAMIEEVEKNYNVDPSRVYACGHSAGTGMATALVVRCSDLVTAIATSAPVFGEGGYEAMKALVTDPKEVAVLASLGTMDEYAVEQEGVADVDGLRGRSYMEYWKDFYGFDPDNYAYYKNGNYENYVYCKADGTPVYQWVKVEGKLHAPLPEEELLFYEFMCKYSRGANGELLYMGK